MHFPAFCCILDVFHTEKSAAGSTFADRTETDCTDFDAEQKKHWTASGVNPNKQDIYLN